MYRLGYAVGNAIEVPGNKVTHPFSHS